ncbi:ATP-binding protein [Thermophagus xiamenensis]|uniref:histidine kinase n=1 Tax=Thermophagus xiamenensis TaxID=385682 RepID=A0A1I2DIW2_9BACT|nr:ATP-binding protein [Thermophagus xiamenensis]SFE79870.1 HAMP domain-containing protein [Thermophagus xiamenensis]
MSGRRLRWILLALFVAGTVTGMFLEFFFPANDKRDIDISQIERSVQERQLQLNNLLKSLSDDQLNNPRRLWQLMDSVSRTENDVLIFRNNQLIAWSDQRIPVKDLHPVFLMQPFVQLENGYYLTQQIRKDPFLLIGLARIKESYPYQNKYLKDRFLLLSGLSPSVQIVRQKNPAFEPVYGLEGEYLFSLSNLTRSKGNDNVGRYILVAYLIAAFSFWGLMFTWLQRGRGGRRQNLRLLIAVILFMWVSYGLLWHDQMIAFSQMDLFSPIHFAVSDFFPSLGAMFLFSVGVLLLSILFFRFFRWPASFQKMEKGLKLKLLFILNFFAVQAVMLFLLKQVYSLVNHSSGPTVYFKVIELNEIAIVKICILAFLFFSYLLITERVVRLFLFRINRNQLFFLVAIGTLISILLWGGVGYGKNDWGLLFGGIVWFLMVLVKRDFRLHHSYNTFLWLVALFSLFTGMVLIDLSLEKEKSDRELLVENLSFQLLREEDPVAEMYLQDIEKKIMRDAPLRQLLAQTNINQSAIRNHLLKYYFYGYWGRYELQIVPCWPGGNVVFEATGDVTNCYHYFYSLISQQGSTIDGSSHFYYLNNDNGRVSFLGVFRFFEGHPLETTLFIELQSKPYFEGLGYPELLISQKEQDRLKLVEIYSYAKYVDGRLVKRSGEFDYHGNIAQTNLLNESKVFVKDKGYSHLIFRPEPDTVIILSLKDHTVSDIFIAFSVFFIFFFLIGLILVELIQIRSISFSFKFSVQKRIQLSFIGLMLLILLVVAIGTVLYTVNQFKNKHEDLLNDKVQSVLLELESKIGLEGPLDHSSKEYLNYQLQTISNVFLCDINLFGIDGMLLASSRSELFEQGLIGTQMNPSAYYVLAIQAANRFLEEESIGELTYTSYYVPFYNRDDILIGYVNVPYFVANNELKEEVSSVVMTVINFYLLFSFIIMGITVFLSRQITRPLQVLQNKLADLKIDKHNEKIDYHGNDEIGNLVGEYNRMVDELAESAAKLARTERELAWREMARQIAHEIKNPLTPMKLNIQYLQRAWDDKVPDFGAFLKRVSQTLIEQIEKLSSIATEFSHFAKMPAAKRENIDLLEKIRSSVTLFSGVHEVDIHTDFNGLEKLIINADGEQILGVFNNLINNAVQAIPRNMRGIINVSVSVTNGNALVKIKDNGRGIPEEIRDKMFVPNFTTKSAGMGLGLAIVKGTVESVGGKIWFETETGKGTTFFLQLPLVSQS